MEPLAFSVRERLYLVHYDWATKCNHSKKER